ncbi:MAG: pentapeptide repeat-containing protein [Pseudomonadota bacterium]
MSDDSMAVDVEKQLTRITAITANARATWIGLLGVLVYCGVTLMGVEDVDFFALDNMTLLPFLNVSIPITFFFVSGAVLVAAIYVYHHIYLELLWKELGTAPPRIDGQPLNKVVTPWLVNEWALRKRHAMARHAAEKSVEPMPAACVEPRAFGWLGTIMSTTMVWGFAPLVVGLFWWQSAPAHYDMMTAPLGLLMVAMLAMGWHSWRTATRLLGGSIQPPRPVDRETRFVRTVATSGVFTILGVLVVGASLARTASDWFPGMHPLERAKLMADGVEKAEWIQIWRLANGGSGEISDYWDERRTSVANASEQWALASDKFYMRFGHPFIRGADLSEAYLTALPTDWLSRAEAEKEFRAAWAERESLDYADPFAALDGRDVESEFTAAWRERRKTYLDVAPKPNLAVRNLKGANLSGAFLPGVDLREAQLEGADLDRAQLEGANLFGAQLEGAELSGAQLQGAKLWEAQLEGADLDRAQLEGANLFGAQLQGAKLWEAQLEGADLRWARLEGADLRWAQLEGANLFGAQLQGANLFGAQLFGKDDRPLTLGDAATLKATSIPLVAFRVADLSGVNVAELQGWETTFGDGSVTLPAGVEPPERWCTAILDDAAFFGRWRFYADADGIFLLNAFIDNHPPIPPDPC